MSEPTGLFESSEQTSRSFTTWRRGALVAVVLLVLTASLGRTWSERLAVSDSRSDEMTEPDDPARLESLGRNCLAEGDLDGAAHWLSAWAARAPQRTEPRLLLGRLALHRNMPGWAVRVLDETRASDPGNYEVLQGLAVAHRLLGDAALARDFETRAAQARRALPPGTGGMGADALPAAGGMP
jgi:hypothetical protein